MKKIISFLSLMTIVLALFAQETEPNEKERIQYKKTKVSAETLMGYGVDENGKALAIGTKKSTRTFDENGNMTMLVEYNQKSTPTSRTVLKYNKENQLTNGLEYQGYDKLIDKYAINYKNGLRTRKIGLLDSNRYEVHYKFDAKARLIEKIKYKEINEKENQYTYNYTVDLLAKETFWSKEFTLIRTFEYDSLGQLIKENNQTDKYEGYSFEYEYDTLGNKIKETKFSTEHIPYEWFEFSYMPDGQTSVIEKYNYLGNKNYTWKYFYDAKNNLEFVKIYEAEDSKPIYITQYLYKYFGTTTETGQK